MQLKTHNFGGCFRDNNRLSDITSGTQLVDQGQLEPMNMASTNVCRLDSRSSVNLFTAIGLIC